MFDADRLIACHMHRFATRNCSELPNDVSEWLRSRGYRIDDVKARANNNL
jgi:hypothetical protein